MAAGGARRAGGANFAANLRVGSGAKQSRTAETDAGRPGGTRPAQGVREGASGRTKTLGNSAWGLDPGGQRGGEEEAGETDRCRREGRTRAERPSRSSSGSRSPPPHPLTPRHRGTAWRGWFGDAGVWATESNCCCWKLQGQGAEQGSGPGAEAGLHHSEGGWRGHGDHRPKEDQRLLDPGPRVPRVYLAPDVCFCLPS